MSDCCYCGSQGKKNIYQVREMMYGTKEQFNYLECANCGGLQIETIPQEMSKYYPSNYYSFSYSRDSLIKRSIKKLRFQYSLTKSGIIGKILVKKFGEPQIAQWLAPTKIDYSDPVLDVGCGDGSAIIQMNDVGFTDLTGIDPYIEKDNEINNGLRLLKKDIYNLTGSFKLIMFHHSLEHVESPLNYILAASKLLQPGQLILLRVPVVGGLVWRDFLTDWVQLDAPRHISIPSRKSIEILAQKGGFTVEKVIYDSSAFQFWGSEQYKMDIPFYDDRSYGVNPKKSLFSEADIEKYNLLSTQLNNEQDGDQACFYLRKNE